MKNSKLGVRKWFSFIIAGLIGQLAWAIENNYLNVFVFDCTGDTKFMTWMTITSAIAATVTTLFIGALLDRLGKRKIFVSIGYIIWGISIIAFAFLDPRKPYNLVFSSALASGITIVVMDCVMTFFGSTANDAAFNAFVTDNTKPTNRGKVESVLSIFPLIAGIAVILLQGILVGAKQDGVETNWLWFFVAFGALTTIIGVVCLFLLPKDTKLPNKEEPYLKNIVHGFRPKVIKERPELYLTLLTFMIFSIAIQIFMTYFMVYIQDVLKFDLVSTAGPILGTACVLTVVFGLFMDKIGKYKLVFGALSFGIIGAILLFFLQQNIGVIIGGIILMTGYLVATAVLGAKIRDYTPEKETGLFQGVRMVFVVMIPMIIGPLIGRAACYVDPHYALNAYGEVTVLPNQYVFLFTAITMVLVVIPLVFLLIRERKHGKENTTK